MNAAIVQHASTSRPAARSVYLRELRESFVELVASRSLLYQFMLRDLRIRYKQAILGFAWGLLMPALIVLGGFIARSAMGHIGLDSIASDLAAIIVKAIPWAFFVGSVSFATNSLVANLPVVTKIYFPRSVLPLAAVAAHAVDAAVASVVAGVVLGFMGTALSMAMLWVPVLALLIVFLTAAAALFFSCINLFFRDVKYLVQVVLMFGIFFTPVFFDTSMFSSRGAHLLMLNPLTPLLEGLRLAVLQGHNIALPLMTNAPATGEVWSPWFLLYSTVWSLGGFGLAMLVFHRLEFLFAEHI
jgi:ABC-type polysaccharide/polyol phosphate export permease